MDKDDSFKTASKADENAYKYILTLYAINECNMLFPSYTSAKRVCRRPELKLIGSAILITVLLFLTGCSNTSLYSNLTEKEANEMQAILLNHGINCDKEAGKENTWGLSVSKNHLGEAVEILNGFGYPKEKITGMDEMFKKQGLISSHLEERVRYIYALSQEVSETISRIDGVITARVHIVLPDNDPLSEFFQPSSASVYVKHRQTLDFTPYVHQIKQLVVNSIEGLNYEKVTVFPEAVSVVSAAPRQYQRVMGIEVEENYAGRFQMLVYGLLFFLSVVLIFCCYLMWQVHKLGGLKRKIFQELQDGPSRPRLQDRKVNQNIGRGNLNDFGDDDSPDIVQTNQTMGMKLKQRSKQW